MPKAVQKSRPIPQKVFEGYLELLITYKKLNPKKEVSLTENSIKNALTWYQTYIKDPELLRKLTNN